MLKRITWVIIISVLMLAAVGCGASQTTDTTGQQEESGAQGDAAPQVNPEPQGDVTVVYGGSSWLGHYPVMVGIEKGFFSEEGLRVIFQGFYTSSGRMGSMAAGQLDFASTGSISGLALMASGNESFYAVGTQDSYATVEGIIAKNDIKAVEDLRGKKLAVTFSSSAHVLVYDILEQYGLEPGKDVELINLGVNDMVSAFRSGEIDAAAAWTPAFENLLALPDAELLVNDESFSLWQEYELGPGPDLIVGNKDFIDNNPEISKKFLQGYFRSIQFLQSNTDESAEIIKEYTKLDLEQQKETLKAITWYGLDKQKEFMVDPGTFISGLEKLSDFLVQHQLIDNKPDVRKYVNTDVLPDSI